MRAAGCFLTDVIFCFEHRYKTVVKFNTDTQDATPTIPLTSVDCLLDDNPENAHVICAGLVEGAKPLPEFQHPQEVFYIPTKGSLKLAQAV